MQQVTKSERKLHMPSPAEDQAIQQSIAEDPDASELDDGFFQEARPAADVLGKYVVEAFKPKRGRSSVAGREAVSLLLDGDVLAALKSMGPDWQSRVNELLRAEIAAGRLQRRP